MKYLNWAIYKDFKPRYLDHREIKLSYGILLPVSPAFLNCTFPVFGRANKLKRGAKDSYSTESIVRHR